MLVWYACLRFKHRTVRRLGAIGVLWAMILVLLVAGTGVRAALPADQFSLSGTRYKGAAILLLIDQSGSMGGAQYRGPGQATDPQNLRFHGAQAVARFLGDFRHMVTPHTPIHLAVVNFGGSPRLGLDWTELAPISGYQSWDQQQAMLDDLLSPQRFGQQNLGWTDFETAVRYAKRMFDEAAFPSDYLKSIIVLTDGQPCVSENCTTQAGVQAGHGMMKRIETMVKSEMPSPDYQLFVVGIENPGTPWVVQFQPDWLSVVQKPTHFKAVDTQDEIIAFFYDILFGDSLSQLQDSFSISTVQLDANNQAEIFIPPYLQQVDIVILKDQPVSGETLTAVDPNGKAISSQDPDITVIGTGQNDFVEKWSIFPPMPGLWKLKIDPSIHAHVSLRLGEYKPSVSVGADPQKFLQWSDTTLQIELFYQGGPNGSKIHLDELAAYPLKLIAEVVKADNPAVSQQLTFSNVGTGIYQASFVGVESGVYHVYPQVIAIDANNVSGQGAGAVVTTLLDSDPADPSSAVLNVEAFEAQPVIIPPSTDNWLEQKETQTLALRIVDASSGSTMDSVFNSLSVTARLLNPDGTEAQSTPLQLLPDQPNTFEGEIIPQAPGTYTLQFQGALSNAGGSTQLVFAEVYSSPITVRPLHWTQVRLVEPVSGVPSYALRPPWSLKPLTIRVQVVDNQGNLVDLEQVSGVSRPVSLQISSADGSAETVTLVQVAPGSYEARLDYGLDKLGAYKIEALGAEPLSGDYAYAQDASGAQVGHHATVVIDRVIDPMMFVFLGGLALAVIGSLVTIFTYRRWLESVTVNPVEGQLTIYHLPSEMDEPFPLKTYELSGYKRNRIVLGKRRLGKPHPELPLTRLEVTTKGRRELSENGEVEVMAKVGDEEIQTKLTPGGSRWLLYTDQQTGDRFWLAKDMTDWLG